MIDQARSGGPPLVLIAEDDATARIMAREALEGEGYRVADASDGKKALELYSELCPDVVLLDIKMPGADGFEVCDEIRRKPSGERVPIMMMTGLNDIRSIQRAYDLGATDFVTKPVNYLIMTQRVRYILRATRTANELQWQKRQLAKAQRIAQFGHYRWDVPSRSIVLSPAAAEILWAPVEHHVWKLEEFLELVPATDRELLRQRLQHCVDRLEPYELEHRFRVRNGTERTVRHVADIDRDEAGQPASLIGIIQDITARRKAEERVYKLAYFDPVTELPNRVLIKELMRHALPTAQQNGRCLAVLFCDLDRFKQVNDTLGHDAGDRLLRAVASRICSGVRQTGESSAAVIPARLMPSTHQIPDMVARIGGDEFVVVVTDVRKDEDTVRVVNRLRETLTRPFTVNRHQIVITASIGISVFPHDGDDVETLLKNADAAMYQAKNRGRDSYQFFTESIKNRALERFSLESDLRHALDRGELLLHYQPQVDLGSGKVMGVEALARWHHPERGMVSPADFIPLAEDTGMIVPIGEWILREACSQVGRWQRLVPGLFASVNLSPRQLREADFPERMQRVLDETGLPPFLLELEITENLLMEDMGYYVGLMRAIRDAGVEMAIDDFGTGYSSLSYLKQLPIKTLKIDRSFVRDLGRENDGGVIVAATIALGHKLGLRVVAEGVESEEQLQILRQERCDVGQGYLFCRPLGSDELTDWLARWTDASVLVADESSHAPSPSHDLDG